MNTTIIKVNEKNVREILDVVERKLNRPGRPVYAFGSGENEMVISGCSITEFASALSERLGKKIIFLKTV